MRPNKNAILLYMARRGMTQQELARASKVPQRTLNDVMAGKSVRPKTLGKVANALRVDPAELLLEEKDDDS